MNPFLSFELLFMKEAFSDFVKMIFGITDDKSIGIVSIVLVLVFLLFLTFVFASLNYE